jgi:hypothetical protein
MEIKTINHISELSGFEIISIGQFKEGVKIIYTKIKIDEHTWKFGIFYIRDENL